MKEKKKSRSYSPFTSTNREEGRKRRHQPYADRTRIVVPRGGSRLIILLVRGLHSAPERHQYEKGLQKEKEKRTTIPCLIKQGGRREKDGPFFLRGRGGKRGGPGLDESKREMRNLLWKKDAPTREKKKIIF